MYISKKQQKLLFSLAVLLGWILFVPKEASQKQPKEIQTEKIEIANVIATPTPSKVIEKSLEKVQVLRVIDGDTIEIQNASGSTKKLRYIGINTPETVDPRRGVQCFGKEASARNHELVANKEVYLEKDISEIDKYGRLLRYIYLDEAGGQTINEQLVKEGYAFASAYPPDIKYQEQFKEAQKQAEKNRLGLWQIGGCKLPTQESK